MIPVIVITGFLGAGKTTLLKRLLSDPDYADSAVIINEYGDIALDHELLASSDETFVTTSTGCLCCLLRSDLAETLATLHAQHAGRYRRVIIETSGLADPAPILHALMTEAGPHALSAVVTLVDALRPEALTHPEAERQVRLADRLVITKPDLAPSAALRATLATLNPAAPVLEAAHGAIPAAWLLAPAPAMREWLDTTARHSDGLASIVIQRDTPLPGLALTLWLEGLAEHLGARLLRLKGIVQIAESPQPMVIHAIGHVLHPPQWLDAPAPQSLAAPAPTRIVLITQHVPQWWPLRLLSAIEEEVRSAQRLGDD